MYLFRKCLQVQKNLFFECRPNTDCVSVHVFCISVQGTVLARVKSKSQPGEGDMRGKGTTRDDEAASETRAQASIWGTQASYGRAEARKLLRGEEVLG